MIWRLLNIIWRFFLMIWRFLKMIWRLLNIIWRFFCSNFLVTLLTSSHELKRVYSRSKVINCFPIFFLNNFLASFSKKLFQNLSDYQITLLHTAFYTTTAAFAYLDE